MSRSTLHSCISSIASVVSALTMQLRGSILLAHGTDCPGRSVPCLTWPTARSRLLLDIFSKGIDKASSDRVEAHIRDCLWPFEGSCSSYVLPSARHALWLALLWVPLSVSARRSDWPIRLERYAWAFYFGAFELYVTRRLIKSRTAHVSR